MAQDLKIRNSTAEFLIFQAEEKAEGVQVFYKDESIWATQKAMATLFDVDRSVITRHLKNIFETGELQQDSVCAKFAHTAEDGKTYSTLFYKRLLALEYVRSADPGRTVHLRAQAHEGHEPDQCGL